MCTSYKTKNVRARCASWFVLDKITDSIFEDKNDRICLRQRLQQLDEIRTGFVTEPEFRAVLTRQVKPLLPLSEDEICLLVDCFSIADGRINYKQLCDVIESAVPRLSGFSCQEEEEKIKINKLDDFSEKRFKKLEVKIKCRLNELTVVPKISDTDDCPKNIVNHSGFGRWLRFVGIPLSQDEFDLLIRKFAVDPCHISFSGFLHYMACSCDESYSAHTPPGNSKKEDCIELSQNNTECHCDEFDSKEYETSMDRIRLRLKARRIDLRPFLKNCDRLNMGYISVPHFSKIMHSVGFLLTNEELCHLEARYKKELGFDYLLFMRDIEEVGESKVGQQYSKKIIRSDQPSHLNLTRKAIGSTNCKSISEQCSGLKRFSLPGETAHKNFLILPQGSSQISADDRKFASAALTKLSRAQNLNLIDIFLDQDKHHLGSITENQLLQALSRRNLTYLLSSQQLKGLSKVFAKEDGQIDYQALLVSLKILCQHCV